MFQRFTSEARDAVVAAQECARRLRADHIGAEHLLLALLDTTGPARGVLEAVEVDRDRLTEAVRNASHADGAHDDADHLQELGIDLTEVRRRVEETFGSGALDVPAVRRRGLLDRVLPSQHLRFGRDAKKALETPCEPPSTSVTATSGTTTSCWGCSPTVASSPSWSPQAPPSTCGRPGRSSFWAVAVQPDDGTVVTPRGRCPSARVRRCRRRTSPTAPRPPATPR